MKQIDEDFFFKYYIDYFQGNPIQIRKNKFTNEIMFDANDLCKALGVNESFNDFLATDDGLDFINGWKKNHPDVPFFGGAVKTKGEL